MAIHRVSGIDPNSPLVLRDAFPGRLRRIAAVVVLAVLAPNQKLPAQTPRGENPPNQPEMRYDVAIYGTTPGGIAMAVRVAREGRTVLLVGSSLGLGGMLSQGLGAVDSLYHGPRAPIYDEFIAAIHHDYRERYGEDSAQLKSSRPDAANVRVESHVAERLFGELVAREPRISLRRGFYPGSSIREGAVLREIEFRAMPGCGEATFRVTACVFADCSYEGDLAAVAGIPCRIGREARSEFGEEHAGRIFVRDVPWPPAGVDPAYLAAYRKLNITHSNRWSEVIYPQSTGEAHPAVQAYSMRVLLSTDPANFVPISRPADYDRDAFFAQLNTSMYWRPGVPRNDVPNGKLFILQPELIGRQNAYVEGTWAERRSVVNDHRAATLKLLHFFQTDPSLPAATREGWAGIGLPRDEFRDTGHLPDEIYVREGRRIKGRAIVTEHNFRLAAGAGRAPVVSDAISMAEWYLDSHACTAERVGDSLWEGEFYLFNKTWPGQIPLGSILPQGTENLLVPVCLSATHVAYGSVRVEPVWMSLGEAAGHLAVAAIENDVPPTGIASDTLLRRLAERRFLLSFFNDVAAHRDADWYPAVQFLGTKGFFADYDARPTDHLTEALAAAWLAAVSKLNANSSADVTEQVKISAAAEKITSPPVARRDFITRLNATLPTPVSAAQADDGPLARGEACRLILEAAQNSSKLPHLPGK